MKVLIVGANGQIGKHLITYIQDIDTLQARAMIRKEEQASFFETKGAESVLVDLENSIEDIAKAAEGMDVVVFTAGSGPHTGKDKTIEAAKVSGVKRFILISSFDTRREAILSAPPSFAPYVAAKYYADEWLRTSDLDYTIIHPGRLTNDEGNGEIKIGDDLEIGDIPRLDVARVIIESLVNDSTIGKEFQIITGTTPIDEAVKTF